MINSFTKLGYSLMKSFQSASFMISAMWSFMKSVTISLSSAFNWCWSIAMKILTALLTPKILFITFSQALTSGSIKYRPASLTMSKTCSSMSAGIWAYIR